MMFSAYGYQQRTYQATIVGSGEIVTALERGATAESVPTVMRAPLLPWDPDTTDPDTGAPLPVRTTLTARPSDGPDPAFMRANLWGLTLENLPKIEGGNTGGAQSRMLTYLDSRYATADLERGVRRYASYGYTHWWRSWPDAYNHGNGQTLAQYVDMSRRIQDLGVPYICHFMRSKDYDAHNPDQTDVRPVLEALLQAEAISHESPAWEASLWIDPEHFAQMIEYDASILVPAGVSVDIHLQAGYADFGPDGSGHGPIFWKRCLAAGVKRLLYQYNPTWTAGMMQARGNDVSVRLIQGGAWGLPETVLWDGFELCGVPLFNNQPDGDGRGANEDTADLKGYEMCCTVGPLPPSGYGNGARRPNGGVL
jgi:hypothetical protein